MTIGEKIPKVPTQYTEEELRERKEIASLRRCNIYVNTNFRRKNEPIFALAMCEGKRNLAVDVESLMFKSDKESLKIVGQFIKDHYIESNGDLGIWGKIVNYAYHHKDSKSYVFDTNGELLENVEVLQSRASLSLN